MAKIVIEVDGKDVSVQIDGKKVDNLAGLHLSFYNGSKPEWNEVYFNYSVSNDPENDSSSVTSFDYVPSNASFSLGEQKTLTSARAYEGL